MDQVVIGLGNLLLFLGIGQEALIEFNIVKSGHHPEGQEELLLLQFLLACPVNKLGSPDGVEFLEPAKQVQTCPQGIVVAIEIGVHIVIGIGVGRSAVTDGIVRAPIDGGQKVPDGLPVGLLVGFPVQEGVLQLQVVPNGKFHTFFQGPGLLAKALEGGRNQKAEKYNFWFHGSSSCPYRDQTCAKKYNPLINKRIALFLGKAVGIGVK